MTNHFNGLSEAEAERLALLIEECGEVIQAACKILRHGYASSNPDIRNSETNRQMLGKEIGHVQHAIRLMTEAADIGELLVLRSQSSKAGKIFRYLHHQGQTPGTANESDPSHSGTPEAK